MPLRLTSPTVGLIPTRPATADGQMMLPSVSVPMPTAARLAAIAVPVPALEPQGLRSSAYGFLVCPPRALQPEVERVERMFAHSLRLVLPRITAPAARSRATRNAFDFGRCSATACAALGIQRIGFLQCVGIGLDHGIEPRAGVIDRGDAVQVGLGQCAAGQRARGHLLLERGDAGFLERKRRGCRGFRRGRLRGVGLLAGGQQQQRDREREAGHRRGSGRECASIARAGRAGNPAVCLDPRLAVTPSGWPACGRFRSGTSCAGGFPSG